MDPILHFDNYDLTVLSTVLMGCLVLMRDRVAAQEPKADVLMGFMVSKEGRMAA